MTLALTLAVTIYDLPYIALVAALAAGGALVAGAAAELVSRRRR